MPKATNKHITQLKAIHRLENIASGFMKVKCLCTVWQGWSLELNLQGTFSVSFWLLVFRVQRLERDRLVSSQGHLWGRGLQLVVDVNDIYLCQQVLQQMQLFQSIVSIVKNTHLYK